VNRIVHRISTAMLLSSPYILLGFLSGTPAETTPFSVYSHDS